MYKKLLAGAVLLCRSIVFGQTAPIPQGETQTDYGQNVKNYTELLSRAEKQLEIINAVKLTHVTNRSNKTMSTDLNLAIVNERVLWTGGFKWFEFDITASANSSGTFLDISFIKVGYNTAVFGSSVVTNGNCIATPSSVLNIPTYNPLSTYVNDNTASEINLPISTSSTFTPLNRWQVSTSATTIMTVRMKIANCNQPYNVLFTSQLVTTNFSWFSPTANASGTSTTIVGYDNVNFSGNVTDQSCQPVITAWTNGVPAGENRTITVTGKYFGNGMVNGAALVFKNADYGDRYPLASNAHKGGIQPIDLVSWTHNQIVTVLPSLVDSADFNVSGQVLPKIGKTFAIGSGKFKVYNGVQGVAESSAPIDIPWNVTQYMDDYPIIPVRYRRVHARLINRTGGGYRVMINNRINTAWAAPAAKPVIKKAMRDWSCATGINWYIGGDTTKKYASQDGICVIDTANQGALGETRCTIRPCTMGNGQVKFYMESFDILIKQQPSAGNWSMDTSSAISSGNYDFYSVISHELGHGHQLSHINDSIKDLMWWQGYPYGYAWASRKLVKGSPEAVSGGNFVTDSLNGVVDDCQPGMTLVYPTNCGDGWDVGIKKFRGGTLNIAIYPNPSAVHESVKIQGDLSGEKPVFIILRDIMGKEIISNSLGNTNRIDYDLRTKEIAPGMYLLQINVGGSMQSCKIIKQ